jgi:hypothetical protein
VSDVLGKRLTFYWSHIGNGEALFEKVEVLKPEGRFFDTHLATAVVEL